MSNSEYEQFWGQEFCKRSQLESEDARHHRYEV